MNNLDAVKAVAYEATRKKTSKKGYRSMKQVAKFFQFTEEETDAFMQYMDYGFIHDDAKKGLLAR